MYGELNQLLVEAAKKKVNFLKESKLKYFVAAMLAGMYVGLGILLIFSIGGLLGKSPASKIVMGLSFGIALSLVVMVGSELFTGNNMVGFGGFLNKAISGKDLASLWITSYIGNFVGAIILAIIYVGSKSGNAEIVNFIIKASNAKINVGATELLLRGILCNILVCLAVMSAIKLKEETAKLIMVFWCLFAFITSGYEHSIANMTLFSAAYLLGGITLSGLMYNLLWVTLGNIIGGSFLGLAYYIMKKNEK